MLRWQEEEEEVEDEPSVEHPDDEEEVPDDEEEVPDDEPPPENPDDEEEVTDDEPSPENPEKPSPQRLVVTGFPAHGRYQSLRTVFSQDAAAPSANGRPHWSTEEGGHLYYSTAGKWFLSSTFTPTELNCSASFTTDGSPVGEAMCQFLDMSLKHADGTMGKFVRRPLTVKPVFPVCDFCSTHGQEAPDGYR